jgi:hypothetical protein
LKKLLIFPALFFVLSAGAQINWKQYLRYNLHVKFNPIEKSLDALMKLDYTNHSPDTLTFIWFHVWPNAYKNDRTLYSDQLLENGDTRFYFSSREKKGYINRLAFRVNDVLAVFQDHPEYIDLIKLILPKPLLPGDSIVISSSFHLQIPFNFNGNGYSAHHFELKNWYPEPAVYDKHGWHPLPFLVQGGAYHETGDFDVEIQAPAAYRIATGAITDEISVPVDNVHRFSMANVNSFAWIADNHYLLKKDEFETYSGQKISIQYFYSEKNASLLAKILNETKKEMGLLSTWLGPFPYPGVSILGASILPDQNFSGLVSIGLDPSKNDWRSALRSGLTEQWIQTAILNDQRNQPWLSKGFIEFYDQRLRNCCNVSNTVGPPCSNHNLWLRVAENEKTTQPIFTKEPEFSTANDTLIAGSKAALWLRILQDSLGVIRFDQNMIKYISHWKFNHPYPDDFKAIMETETEKNLKQVFVKLYGRENLFPDSIRRTIKPAFIFSAKNSERYNYIGLSPIPGFNRYDGPMLGALIHNINLPENKIEFLFAPLYAFGSKTLVGLGRISYSWHPDLHFSRISIGINGARFDTDKAIDSSGKIVFENFSKLVPYIRVDFKPTDPRSTVRKWIDLKTYLITEKTFGQFAVSPGDSLIHPNSVSTSFRYVNQLSFNLQDGRALYPYGFRAEFQQSELFYRINLHANYFLNYPDGGGLQVRFFAAKFGVWNNNNDAFVSRYEPKLLGVNGEEDYLYEDYFVGRSASYALEKTSVPNGGLAAQQIMNRDGGLKLRIDAFDYVQGKSANWVSSLNFNTTLPASLFPFPVPIRLFFDVGTYAEAWENNPPTSRFLYTGGIQLSLLRNVLNIYAPIIYSSDFNDALGSTSFGRKITFSIDIQNINYKKLIRKAADHD